MQITKQADYAVRAVLYLSEHENGRRMPTNKIAAEQKIPSSFLAKIISQLAIAGLVQTSRGAKGGVALSRPAREISLLDVVEAIDGPITLNECVLDPSACPFGENCKVHNVWCEVHEELVNKLEASDFQTLVS
jgi:Rrf2 family protein